MESPFHHFFQDRLKSITIVSFTSILEKVLPESEPCAMLYDNFRYFINVIKHNNQSWQSHYLNSELLLLTQLGFKVDLSKCAVTDVKENLQFISPKTGRAVSKKAEIVMQINSYFFHKCCIMYTIITYKTATHSKNFS